MTKIPSVEEVVYNFGKQFDELKMKPPKNSMPGLERELIKDFMRKALTADRTALLTELSEWAEAEPTINDLILKERLLNRINNLINPNK